MNIIEWLRQPSRLAFDPQLHSRMNEAADEIEHLTKERDLALANADAVYAKLMPEVERLRAAIIKTLEDNRHLADGENCTLIHLKRIINQQNGGEK